MLSYLSKLSFNKEVIFIDDRNDKSIDIRKTYNVPNEYKIINSSINGENIGTFESRRTGTLNATGEYIWFVDVDDEPLDIDLEIDENNLMDVYMYLAMTKDIKNNTKIFSLKIFDLFPKTIINKIDLNVNGNENSFINFTKSHLDEISVFGSIWNKFFKTSIIRNVYENIPITKNFIIAEDVFIIILYFNTILKKRNLKIQILNKPIYKYNYASYCKHIFNKNNNHLTPTSYKIAYQMYKDSLKEYTMLKIAFEILSIFTNNKYKGVNYEIN